MYSVNLGFYSGLEKMLKQFNFYLKRTKFYLSFKVIPASLKRPKNLNSKRVEWPSSWSCFYCFETMLFSSLNDLFWKRCIDQCEKEQSDYKGTIQLNALLKMPSSSIYSIVQSALKSFSNVLQHLWRDKIALCDDYIFKHSGKFRWCSSSITRNR